MADRLWDGETQESAPHICAASVQGFRDVNDCTSCAAGKATRAAKKSVNIEEEAARVLIECVGIDVVGPVKHRSLRKSKYFVTVLDYYSGYALLLYYAS